MNSFVISLISNALTLMEFAILSVLEFLKMDFRHNAVLRRVACLSLGVFLCVLFSFFGGFAPISLSSYVSVFYDASLFVLLLFSCVFLISGTNTTRFFNATVVILGVQSLKVVLFLLEDGFLAIGLYVENFWMWVAEIFLFLLDCVYLYEIFRKNYQGKTDQVSSKFGYVYLILFLTLTLRFETIRARLAKKAVRYSLILSSVWFLYIILRTSFLLTRIKQEENNANISILKQRWNEDRKQYQIQKESREIINIKCHDLKHRIQNLKEAEGDSKGAKELRKQLEDNIDIYDSIIKTGNEALDVILSNVALRASKKGIQLTSRADGGCLVFLEEGDTYSLFENRLDNAMEYEDNAPDKNDTFISLTVKKVGRIAHIHCENFYYGNVVRIDGKPVTKKDKMSHGFGIRSREQRAKKYNGQFNAFIADGRFQIDIRIPVPEKQNE